MAFFSVICCGVCNNMFVVFHFLQMNFGSTLVFADIDKEEEQIYVDEIEDGIAAGAERQVGFFRLLFFFFFFSAPLLGGNLARGRQGSWNRESICQKFAATHSQNDSCEWELVVVCFTLPFSESCTSTTIC